MCLTVNCEYETLILLISICLILPECIYLYVHRFAFCHEVSRCGKTIFKVESSSGIENALELGESAAEKLLSDGASGVIEAALG